MGKNTRTILICSGKGGVGKTTLTANLGIALANSGATTAVLDADFGLRNLDLLLGLENRIIYTAQDVLDKNCRLDQALVRHKKEPNLALLPAGDPRMLDWMKPEDMKKISELLSEKFDFVLVDCPAGVEDGFKNALAACKEAIVVTNPELSAVRDADRVIGILNTSDIEPIQLVINRVRPNMMASQEMLSIEDVQGILSLPLLGIVLAVHPPAALCSLGLFLVVLTITKYVSLGSMLAGIAFPLFISLVFKTQVLSLIIFSSVVAVLIIVTHQKNILPKN